MRDKLIELLKQKYDHYCDQCGVNKQSNYIENLADYLIANGVTFAPDNNVPCKWIPVSERLPEKGGLYLVCIDVDILGDEDRAVSIEQYVEMWEGWYVDGCRITNITHWMPLPEAPKEGE